ncbi:MAG: hypothetical protein NTV49_06970 [Kiritimatiellaeota bacterium]|nr:hypothetical protein [Kiritimatiellota bacterium]
MILDRRDSLSHHLRIAEQQQQIELGKQEKKKTAVPVFLISSLYNPIL